MEPAARVFAREFNGSQSTVDDTPAGRAVVTPSGAHCHRLFIVGALTERKGSGSDVMHARLADPTGTFSLTVDRRNPDAAATLEYIDPPAFVAVTGQAVAVGTGPRMRTSVAVETITVVDRTVRDLWVVRTAEATLDRLEALGDSGDLAAMVASALESVRSDLDVGTVEPVNAVEIIRSAVEEGNGPRGLSRRDAIARGVAAGLAASAAEQAIDDLLLAGECYSPSAGMIRLI
jgi:RPA family protein